jgi:poly(3-hydroxyalkanoate) synthetase
MKIENGMVDLASLDCPGFAVAAEPDWASMERMPASKWR